VGHANLAYRYSFDFAPYSVGFCRIQKTAMAFARLLLELRARNAERWSKKLFNFKLQQYREAQNVAAEAADDQESMEGARLQTQRCSTLSSQLIGRFKIAGWATQSSCPLGAGE
jgi:hypothetical protein